jgi:redox-sensitive bicupin YhaK (pirin superfamily)
VTGQVGGPHPHAGFETVTLILDGAIFDRDEGGTLNAGEVQWMTAGSGIIHSEDVRTKGEVRLLQLWLTLPKNKRWTAPGFQAIDVNAVPVRHELGAEIQVYSGSSGGLHSGTRNHVPVIMVEINLEPHASAKQDIPSSYNGFAFVIDGSVRIGNTVLNTGQVGWLDRRTDNGTRVACSRRKIWSAGDFIRGTTPRRPHRVLWSICRRLEAGHCQTLC